jgi:hypothetical protein
VAEHDDSAPIPEDRPSKQLPDGHFVEVFDPFDTIETFVQSALLASEPFMSHLQVVPDKQLV